MKAISILIISFMLLTSCVSQEMYKNGDLSRYESAEIYTEVGDAAWGISSIDGVAHNYVFIKRLYLKPKLYEVSVTSNFDSTAEPNYLFKFSFQAKPRKTYTFMLVHPAMVPENPNSEMCLFEQNQGAPKQDLLNEFRKPSDDAQAIECVKITTYRNGLHGRS